MLEKNNVDRSLVEQAKQELTEKKERLLAKKQALLEQGPYDINAFSPPGEAFKCEHAMPRLVVRGGLPLYLCDDCEHYLLGIGAQAMVIPKQHIPAYSLFMMSHFLAYEGPQALADALVRPHVRLDKPVSPSLPPASIIGEMKEMWQETLHCLAEYEEQAKLESAKQEALMEQKNGL